MNLIVNLYRYFKGDIQYDNWSEKEMYYVLTNSGNFVDWLHIRKQIKLRRIMERRKMTPKKQNHKEKRR